MITSKECFDKFGEPGLPTEGKYMVVFDVPTELVIGFIPKKIYCNKLIVVPLKQAFKNLIDRKFVNELKTWDGCYQVRKMRGLTSQSLHSWGLAVDLNQATNQLGKEPTLSAGFVKCFTDADMQVINGVFIDLDDCEKENIALGKIVAIQDTMLKSKIELQELYKKQADYNEELKYQLTAAINTQIQRFNILESAYKQQGKQQKKRSIITGTSLGIGLSISLAVVIFQILK